MGDTHITVENAEGTSGHWRTTETFKVDDSVAKALDAMKKKPTGEDLASWVQDHGGVLDDGNGKPARISTKDDGTVLNDHYKDGNFTTSDVVESKSAKADNNANAQVLLAFLTGGASLLVTPFTGVGNSDSGGSKFTNTSPAPADATAAAAPATAPAATAPKPPAPKPKSGP